MTGRRPDTTKIYDLETHFRDTIGKDVVTLANTSRTTATTRRALARSITAGWTTRRRGRSRSQPSGGPNYVNPETLKDLQQRREQADREKPKGRRLARLTKGPSWEAADVDDDEKLPDGRTAAAAIKAMNAVKDQPFFLAVGFIKPHLPFVAPKKYFDLYPPASQIALPPNSTRPTNAPDLAFTDFGELRGISTSRRATRRCRNSRRRISSARIAPA
jgi:iduronate 2-sulfatase